VTEAQIGVSETKKLGVSDGRIELQKLWHVEKQGSWI